MPQISNALSTLIQLNWFHFSNHKCTIYFHCFIIMSKNDLAYRFSSFGKMFTVVLK